MVEFGMRPQAFYDHFKVGGCRDKVYDLRFGGDSPLTEGKKTYEENNGRMPLPVNKIYGSVAGKKMEVVERRKLAVVRISSSEVLLSDDVEKPFSSIPEALSFVVEHNMINL